MDGQGRTINLYHANVNTADVRRETMGGKEWLIVPVVALVEGVVNGAFVSGEEIERSIRSWNGRPVSIDHPQKNGHFISVNSPDVIQGSVVGNLFNADFDGNRFRGEIWLDIPKAEELGGDALEAVNMFEAGELVEVSTAYWADHAERQGTFNGKPYTVSQHNLLPDHLAILLHDEGACSLKDGCGAPRVNKEERMDTNARSTARTPNFTGTEDTEWSKPTLGDYISGLSLDADSWEDLSAEQRGRVAAHTLLGSADSDTFAAANVLPVVNPATGKLNGAAVRNAIARAPQLKGYSQDAIESAQSKGRALLEEHFGGEPEANTVRNTVIQVLKALGFNVEGDKPKETKMEELIKELVSNERCDFTAEELQAMPESAVEKIVAQLEAGGQEEPGDDPPETNVETDGGDDPPAWFTQWAEKEEKERKALAERVDSFAANVEAQEAKEREEIVGRLAANEACSFDAEELEALTTGHLRKLDKDYRARSYAGRGFSAQTGGGDEEEVLAMPSLVPQNGNGGD